MIDDTLNSDAADLDPSWVADVVRRTLDEDLGGFPGRDVTTFPTIAPDAVATAHLVARADGVVAGLAVVPEAVAQVADRFGLPPVDVRLVARDGDRVAAGSVLAELRGPTRVLLVAERSLLNLASRASGVATATRRWADALEGTGTTVLDTRKTTPGLRVLEKYAVRCGGGTNKRMGLHDVAMVKDNHVVAAGSVTAAVAAVRAGYPDVLVQVEADTVDQAVEAVGAGARFLLLDNMGPAALAAAVVAVRALEPTVGRVELEATGNLTLDVAAQVAAAGVDYMSVGALTHSAPILDLALDLLPGD
ncbi:carboxylating nicotinate-nucleotide diphosphorylase [Sanguibacter suaedae]|uniref:Nicotinate-nucleotide pyrophosphorylase [carboxylating] n=1 Tax=Sanguibacter suaedae TaxID=2795737 RepID=A0A934IFV1_9MICO|nr:carboxylating nicotinate-nucleotide diphosphorylase [Sanguibacter suaedae]MBI9116229.1 carboxylating nicotinate-nucleotide diphosphorylase [Sanguibacter suaedae]